MNLSRLLETLTLFLALINIFQWLDKRSKNKSIENFVFATQSMARSLQQLFSKKTIVYQKSTDISENCKAIIKTITGNNRITQEPTNWSRWWRNIFLI